MFELAGNFLDRRAYVLFGPSPGLADLYAIDWQAVAKSIGYGIDSHLSPEGVLAKFRFRQSQRVYCTQSRTMKTSAVDGYVVEVSLPRNVVGLQDDGGFSGIQSKNFLARAIPCTSHGITWRLSDFLPQMPGASYAKRVVPVNVWQRVPVIPIESADDLKSTIHT